MLWCVGFFLNHFYYLAFLFRMISIVNGPNDDPFNKCFYSYLSWAHSMDNYCFDKNQMENMNYFMVVDLI